MEGFLELKIAIWKRTLLTRSVALFPAVAVALLQERIPQLTLNLGEWLNVSQSIMLPFALLPLLRFVTDERIMGKFTISGKKVYGLAVTAFVLMATNFYLVFLSVNQLDDTLTLLAVSFASLLYFGFLGGI